MELLFWFLLCCGLNLADLSDIFHFTEFLLNFFFSLSCLSICQQYEWRHYVYQSPGFISLFSFLSLSFTIFLSDLSHFMRSRILFSKLFKKQSFRSQLLNISLNVPFLDASRDLYYLFLLNNLYTNFLHLKTGQ